MPGRTGKLFYKIGEVSRLAQVEPYILRYWEGEFPALSPRKSSGGQRVYQQKDLDLVLSIKRMLHEEGYTIAGARKKIAEGGWGGLAARGAGGIRKRETETAAPGATGAAMATGTMAAGGKDAPETMQKAGPEPLQFGFAAEFESKPQKSAPKKVKRDLPQMALPFFAEDDKSGIQDALVKFKAEIKEIIELVRS